MRRQAHRAHRHVLIEVPSIERASGDAGVQILRQGEFKRGKADGGLPSMEGGTQEEEEAPPPCRICASSLALSVSPITGSSDSPSKSTRSKTPTTHASTPTTPGSRQLRRLKPKPKLTRRNSRVMQKHRVHMLAMSDFSKQALKRAKLWYARESKKPDGLSLYEIADKARKEFNGVGPHAATIWKYVKANLQGM